MYYRRMTAKLVRVTRSCLNCPKTFETKAGGYREKVTCSVACANTYFRSYRNNREFLRKDSNLNHARICWMNHERKCIVCGEDKVVEAHHYNGVHSDNRPENFAPLCPTHHQYWHSRHRYLIQEKVDAYVNEYIAKFVPVSELPSKQ